MKTKEFTKKEVEKKIKKVLAKFEKRQKLGRLFPLTEVLGDYTYNSRNRHIKEVVFVSPVFIWIMTINEFSLILQKKKDTFIQNLIDGKVLKLEMNGYQLF